MSRITENPAVTPALASDPDLSAGQSKLLEILLDPKNDPTERAASPEDMLEELESFSGNDFGEAVTIGEILNAHHDRRTGRSGEFIFELTSSSEGEINGYNVLAATGSSGSWMAASGDEKYLLGARYELSGLRAALKIAETLSEDYARITRLDVSAALNQAAEDVTDLHPDGEHVRDSVNLVVNAALHYLEHPHDDLTAAIETNYDESVEEVTGWVSDPDG